MMMGDSMEEDVKFKFTSLDCLVPMSREAEKQVNTPDHPTACTKISLNWPGKCFNLVCAERWKFS
jgi:hypothetical protein